MVVVRLTFLLVQPVLAELAAVEMARELERLVLVLQIPEAVVVPQLQVHQATAALVS